jgi:hypothetical protein
MIWGRPHADEPCPISAGAVVAGVSAPLRYRDRVRASVADRALAAGTCLSALWWHSPQPVCPPGSTAVAMHGMPAPVLAARRHRLRQQQAAADHLVSGLVPAEPEQDQLRRAGADAASGRYRTAWRIKHKLMQAMSEREANRRLGGLVQLDDAYLGGERNGGKPGRGSENKRPFVVAVSTTADNRPRQAVIEPVPGFTQAGLTEWAQRRLRPGKEVYAEHRARQRQERAGWHLPCIRVLQVCPSRSGRSGVAVQSSLPARRAGATTAGRRCARTSLVRTPAACSSRLCWLTLGANQVEGIGIGGRRDRLVAPLPHHPACGSAPGGSSG